MIRPLHAYLSLCVCMLSFPAFAADPGMARRATDIYERPSYSADKIKKLNTGTRLEVLERRGAWYYVQVSKDQQQGWVRMLNIRLGSAERKKGSSGIGALAQFARTGTSGRVVATGVRGLTEENIRNAKPDPKEFRKMTQYQVSAADAKRFARNSDLQAQKVSFLEEASKRSTAGSFDEEEEGLF